MILLPIKSCVQVPPMERAYSLNDPKYSSKSQIHFSVIRKENEGCLRQINRSLFLVFYDDEYYNALLSSPLNHSFLIHDDERQIGIVSFRVQGSDAYLYTFGLLPELRGRGLGNIIFAHLELYIRRRFNISALSLHVHSSNEKAKSFYLKNGFSISSIIPDYYTGINPSSAYFMLKVYPKSEV